MKILFIGDIFGNPGRDTIKKVLPKIKAEHKPDFVIANAENTTHGNGFSPETISELQKSGVNFFTLGDHAWGNHDGILKMDDPKFPVIRPANFPPKNVPGRGYAVVDGPMMTKILIINLMGRVFMKRDFDCPFRALDQILEQTRHENLSAIIVDFHAEATSEKYALGFYADGRVSAVLGTHTHVATNDLRILDGGTAYISDVGMVGPYDSVIGVKKEIIIRSFLTQMPVKHEPETSGKMVFNSVLLEIDEKTKKTISARHLQEFL
jgi:metallophosphoesterase (TIGR00282 family)